MFILKRASKLLVQLKRFSIKKNIPIKPLILKKENREDEYTEGTYFGEKNGRYHIHTQIDLPSFHSESDYRLEIYTSKLESDTAANPQIKVYINNQLIQGVDVNHSQVQLNRKWSKQTIQLELDIFAGNISHEFPLFVRLIEVDRKIEDTYIDLKIAIQSCSTLEEDSSEFREIATVIKNAINQLDFRTPYSKKFYYGINQCQDILQFELYQNKKLCLSKEEVLAVGHTHIDLAWLWTVEQAIEKGERSFSTVLKLMEEFPEYQFIQSQPQLYDFIKMRYPDLYEKIKEKIREGRWEPEGAMWVEADCNLTSGESLVRQLLYGKRFFKKEFGVESRILWLPDVFGYSAALPQLLKLSNVDYFMTTKLSWNQFNQIPYDTFYWQGIDGSQVLTHQITTTSKEYQPTPYYTTYNGLLDPDSVVGAWERYQQKDLSNQVLMAYGYGDGGGGPTREMLETARRLKNGLPGIPKVKLGTALQFFEYLKRSIANKKTPIWMGELYFEYHRGTYTSIGKNKRFNRLLENFLQSLEKLYSLLDDLTYPKEKLENMWKLVLLNQFHDILPGSAIEEVYQQTDQEYKELLISCEELLQRAFSSNYFETKDNHFLIFNPIAKNRKTVCKLPVDKDYDLIDSNGNILKSQQISNCEKLVWIDSIEGLSFIEIKKIKKKSKKMRTERILSRSIETPFYTIQFDEYFQFASIYSKKEKREILPKNHVGNQLVAYADYPMDYDAWEIDIYYKEKSWIINQVESAKIISHGQIRTTVEIIRKFEQSVIKQHIHFYEDSPRIDFETWIDWQQEHVLLKTHFPVAINSLSATYDIQFGNVERSVHQNTSWDLAKFEVSAQKWMDISENGFGVALLTDSKYGYDADYQKMGLTLLKSATDPYQHADKGSHYFVYALYPHSGDVYHSDVIDQGYDFNVPLLIQEDISLRKAPELLLMWQNTHVILDTVKVAEDEDCLIYRFFETENKQDLIEIMLDQSVESVWECNLLEENIQNLPIDNHKIECIFKPFEIKTFKVKRKMEFRQNDC